MVTCNSVKVQKEIICKISGVLRRGVRSIEDPSSLVILNKVPFNAPECSRFYRLPVYLYPVGPTLVTVIGCNQSVNVSVSCMPW